MNQPSSPSPSSQNPNSEGQPAEPSKVLPIVALVTSLCCAPIGVLLSIVAFIKYRKATGTTAKTLSVIALVFNFVVILPMVGIQAAIAIPNFVKFQCRSKQSEAKGNLKALYVGEESFRADKDRYSMGLSEIGFTPRGAKIRYEYRILNASENSFLAEAVGTGEMAGDRWTVSENNDVKNTENVCQ
jgi:type IV pilus assembly protein PilA